LTNVDRAEAMAGSVERIARGAGLSATDVDLVCRAYALAMEPRRVLDEHDPAFLHPGRSMLVLLQDVGPLAGDVLAAAAVHESDEPGFRIDSDAVGRDLGDAVATIVRAIPLPGDDDLVERLVTLEEGARLAALAERLDHVRHAHLREDPALWRALHDEVSAAWAPVAERTHPRLADRYRAWLRAISRRLGVAACFLAAGFIGAEAQQARVTVHTESDGRAVAGAEVVAGDVQSLTNAAGDALLVLAVGEHAIDVTALGYADAEILLEVAAGADTTIVVELEVEAIEAEEILVLSTRTERRIEDVPLRVEVVAREEVEEKILMTPGDIAMLLNETAGLRVQPTAPSLGGASVRIQGLRGRYTQILSDGLPLYGGQTGALGPLQIPPMDLGQVEVIKGAASALYGATALGGVVNLISRRPERERELLLNQTTLGGTDAVLWWADEPSERWGYTLLASGHRQSHADVDDDGWADLPSFRRAVVRPRVFRSDARGGSTFVTVGLMAEDREGGTVEGGTTPAGTAFLEELETRRGDIGVVSRSVLANDWLLTVRGSGMVQSHRHAFGTATERDRHVTAFAEAALGGQSGRHAWVAGLALQHDRYDGRDVPAFDFAFTIPAIFAQDELDIASWLTASASARFDRHSEYGAFASPRLALLARSGEWTVRASAGSGYFPPSPFTDETEAVGLARLVPYGDLDPERAVGGMLDVGRGLGAWELNATLFGSEIRDALVVNEDGLGGLTLSNASGPVRTWGTELLARIEQGPLHLTTTYVLTRSMEDDPLGPDRREVPLTPRHTVGVVGAWEVEGEGRFGAELYYTGRQELEENPYRTRSSPYFIVGFLIERRLGPVRAFLNAENLLDTRQTGYDRLVLPAQTPEGRWITDVWAPLDGRAFNAGVRIAW
jgi:outer membrane receptor for ferrienterochelin and colicins